MRVARPCCSRSRPPPPPARPLARGVPYFCVHKTFASCCTTIHVPSCSCGSMKQSPPLPCTDPIPDLRLPTPHSRLSPLPTPPGCSLLSPLIPMGDRLSVSRQFSRMCVPSRPFEVELTPLCHNSKYSKMKYGLLCGFYETRAHSLQVCMGQCSELRRAMGRRAMGRWRRQRRRA